MNRRLWPSAARAALAAAVIAAAFTYCVTLAWAAVTTDLNDFNLSESTSTYGGGTQYHVSQFGSLVEYRWLDAPVKSTVINAGSCTDYALVGTARTYAVGSTSYQSLFSASDGDCFVVRRSEEHTSELQSH